MNYTQTYFDLGNCHSVQSGVNVKACFLNELGHFGSDTTPPHSCLGWWLFLTNHKQER